MGGAPGVNKKGGCSQQLDRKGHSATAPRGAPASLQLGPRVKRRRDLAQRSERLLRVAVARLLGALELAVEDVQLGAWRRQRGGGVGGWVMRVWGCKG
jgi:hypothetical protein